MRPKTLLVLAGLIVALLAFILFYERKLPSTEERQQKAKRLFSLEADEITKVELEWSGQKVTMERPPKSSDGTAQRSWKLVEPAFGLADQPAVDRLVSDLARLEFERELAEVDREDAGLESPRGRVRWSGGAQGELRIGAELPAGNQVLVEVERRPGAYVIPRWFVTDLSKTPGDWRSREVLGVGREKISRVTLERTGGPRIVLVRVGERFRLEAPLADEADRDAIDRLLSDLTTLRINRFLDSPLAPEVESGLAARAGRVEVATEGASEPVLIEVGGEVAGSSGERYHRSGSQAFVGRSDLVTALGKEAEAWRSRSWSGFESFEIERITVRDGQGELTLAREGSDWKLGEKTVPYSKAGDLLYAVTSARGEQMRDLAEGEPLPAAPTITLNLIATGGREETLTLHERSGGWVRARRSGRAVELEFPERTLEELERALSALREEAKAKPEGDASEAASTAPAKG